jgi:virginiamycin B lyase
MRMRDLSRFALSACVAAVMLAGCGGSQPSIRAQRPTAGALPATVRAATDYKPVIKEYRIANKHLTDPLEVVFDGSNNLWFSSSFYAYLGSRSPSGSITAHKLPKQRDNYGWAFAVAFATGRRNQVYFTNYYGENVGKIEAGGHIVEYGPWNTYAWTAGLVSTHGRLWVVSTGFFSSDLMELRFNGRLLKRIPLPGYYCYPTPIAASSDGTLWIGYGANCPAIVRVTESGKATEFPIVAADGVWNVVTGPDGNIWFTAADGPTTNDYVGKITPSGEITEYPLPNQADGIVLGPDGNWWLTMPFVGKIAVMTLQGDITAEYTLPKAIYGSQPKFQLGKIVLGSDGNLWFPEGYRNKIGELDFSH